MIVLNITTQVAWAVQARWHQWFREIYLLAILDAGSFTRYQWVKLLEVDEEEGAMYAVQLYCEDLNAMNHFRENALPAFRQIEKKEWGDNVFSFESLMEVIN